jgi:hypothetical protein
MKKYPSRWTTEPSGKCLKRTENDLRYLRLFNRVDGYKLLPRNWITAFVPDLHPNYVRTRIAELCREPFCYLARKTFNGRNINEMFTYYLTERGDRLVGDDGTVSTKQDAEQVLIDLVDASIELGIRTDPSVELLKWGAILKHANTPDRLKTSTDPFTLHLPREKIRPDGRPFVIRKMGKGAVAFFKEVDRATEPLTSRRDREHIKHKFDQYRAAWSSKIYKTQYGFPAAMVLFVTTSPGRMENMMALLGPCPYIAFKTIEDFTVLGLTPPITTKFFDEPWKRAGHPDFALTELA